MKDKCIPGSGGYQVISKNLSGPAYSHKYFATILRFFFFWFIFSPIDCVVSVSPLVRVPVVAPYLPPPVLGLASSRKDLFPFHIHWTASYVKKKVRSVIFCREKMVHVKLFHFWRCWKVSGGAGLQQIQSPWYVILIVHMIYYTYKI